MYILQQGCQGSVVLSGGNIQRADFRGQLQQLADLMKKDKNSVTQLIDAIERKGFVVRQQNAQDRRSNTIVLTEKAMGLRDEAKQKGISILDEMLDGISEEELHSFLATLQKLNDNMSGQ